jgi:hypothetical protein
MKKINILLVACCALVLTSCKTADQKVPEIAAAYCDCFASMRSTMSADAQNLIIEAANTADPQETLKKNLMALPADKMTTVATELSALSDIETSETGKCLNRADEKYKNEKTMDKKKFMQKLIKELSSKENCKLTGAFMKIGEKMQN